jgi:hypothetical protein
MSEYEFEKMANQNQGQFYDFNQQVAPQRRTSVQRSAANNPFDSPGFGHNGQRPQEYARPPSRGPSYRDATSSFGPVVSGYGRQRNNGPSWEARDDRFARHPSPMRQSVRGPVLSGFGNGNGQMWGSKGNMMSDGFFNNSPGKTSLSDAFVSNCDSRGLMPDGGGPSYRN